MSGPKVIRIVSPEEMALLVARRDALIEQARQQLQLWKSCLEQLNCFDQEVFAINQEYLTQLQKAFFPNYDKAVQSATEEIKRLKEEMKQAKVDYEAKRREARRRVESAAKHLSSMFVKLGQTTPDELRDIEARASSLTDEQLEEVKKKLNGISAQSLRIQTKDADRQEPSQLALQLAEGLPAIERLSDLEGKTSEKTSRIDRLMIELELVEGLDALGNFKDRIETAAQVEPGNQKELLIDSIILDLANACRAQAEVDEAKFVMEQTLAQLKHYELESARDLAGELEKALLLPDKKTADALARKAKDVIEVEASKSYADAKRKAILKGLAELGYEVKEGMATAWAKDGKMVLAKQGEPCVGIEIGSASSLERMQIRAVGISSSGQTKIDGKSIEDSWCSELSKVSEKLRTQGHLFEIEKCSDAGAVPLKIVAPTVWMNEEDEDVERVQRPKSQFKSL